uniref:Putative udp-sugar transporter protein slc35a5-like isoform x1 n=1 Tax=Tabanus bromius TaxID=304241 RepID=A0A0K8TN46_TABBR
MGINWKELFPTKLSVFIFICYMSLFVNQGILVTASQEKNNSYNYNTVTVVLFTEIVKLIVSVVLYCKDESFTSLLKSVKKDAKVLLLYFVPAFLYCLYNNLAFTNLSTFDPTTYYLLLQFRVVITGILFQIIFKKYLSKRQWFSLILLTVGCMLKQFHFGNEAEMTKSGIGEKNMTGFDFSISAAFIFIQTICSCLAGVYNEYLLKDKGAEVNIYVQNVFMYLDSILCNSVILLLKGELFEAFKAENLSSVFRYYVVIIIINNAAIGIITSFFLKYMNSILKTFASALELVFTAIFAYILFTIPIYINTVLAIGVVSFSIYLYSQNPVVNLGKVAAKHEDSEKLLSGDAEEV